MASANYQPLEAYWPPSGIPDQLQCAGDQKRHQANRDVIVLMATKAQRPWLPRRHEGTKNFIATKARRNEEFILQRRDKYNCCHKDTKAQRILLPRRHEGTKTTIATKTRRNEEFLLPRRHKDHRCHEDTKARRISLSRR